MSSRARIPLDIVIQGPDVRRWTMNAISGRRLFRWPEPTILFRWAKDGGCDHCRHGSDRRTPWDAKPDRRKPRTCEPATPIPAEPRPQ